ncbi:hypothetical protein ACFWP7_23425 [Streptomyces sp. NPDC058470]|uniref:hypothetical protein n=1 Tax=Streptomyces sp. NPDC058470 TaxID=3346515 RepID=UPI00364F3F43
MQAKRAAFTPAWPRMYSATPSSASGLRLPIPMRKSPVWATVEYASDSCATLRERVLAEAA